jgi:hypothetical protein
VLIDSSIAFTEPNRVNRFMPLPAFRKPYFTWRDETVLAQGGAAGAGGGSDTAHNRTWAPYIPSPFLFGQGRYATLTTMGEVKFNSGFWHNGKNYQMVRTDQDDRNTGGLLGSIALPLLADFEVHPDDENLPLGRGYRASGANGWQIALAVFNFAQPNFRAFSAGGLGPGGQINRLFPSSTSWRFAHGGYDLTGGRTPWGDNSVYWAQIDFLKRRSVATAGFVDLLDPHRMPVDASDPRLGPYVQNLQPDSILPPNQAPLYVAMMDPPADLQPLGTEVVVEFRGAGIVDQNAWSTRYQRTDATWRNNNQEPPDAVNFPLDPRKAGDAHIRKFDDRTEGGVARRFWTYPYTRHMTEYTGDPNELADPTFLNRFAKAGEPFSPRHVRYVNWRFVFGNNVDSQPAASPVIDTFALTYRFEPR